MISMKKLLEEIETDTKIDPTNLEGELYIATKLHAKYIRYRLEAKLFKNENDTKLAEVVGQRMNFYYGNGTADEYRKEPFSMVVKNQDHMNKLLESDRFIKPLNEMSDNMSAMIEVIDEFVGMLKFRNSHIATAFEIRKFEAGE